MRTFLDFTLEQIQYLREISRSGSLTSAAQKLRRSKSAVTKGIQNLEAQVGFELISREDYRAHLTPNGEAFLVRAAEVLHAAEGLKDVCTQISANIETALSVSIAAAFDGRRIYPLLSEVAQNFPKTRLTLFQETLSGESLLFDGSAELAIVEGLQNRNDIENRSLGTIEFLLVVSNSHPFVKLPQKKRTMKALSAFPQIIQRSTVTAGSASYGIHEAAPKWFVSEISAKKEIIKAGLGWGRLPRHEIENEIVSGQLVHLDELKEDGKVEFFLAKRKKRPLGQVGQFLWDRV